MGKAEAVVPAKEVATTLGVGRAMLNRYAATLEQVTGEKVPISGRDGRQFSEEQVAVLVRAKGLVESHHGLSVEAALKAALALDSSGAEIALKAPGQVPWPQDTGQFVEALREAITAPLVEELRALRAEVVELRQERQLEALVAETDAKLKSERAGLLVRLATRVEDFLSRLLKIS